MPRTDRNRPVPPTYDTRAITYPYFAHQILDPQDFPGASGWALSGPVHTRTIEPGGNRCHPAYGQATKSHGNPTIKRDDLTFNRDPNRLDARGTDKAIGQNPSKRQHDNAGNIPAPKRERMPGGHPVVPKRVTADMDSDDELIVRMKNAKYLEKDIAQRLVDEGRIAYNPKTIGTRWARLKRVMQNRQDELLDADMTDWHDGDDDALIQAIARADADVQRAQEDAASKKWRLVADHMKAIKPVVNFSQNACRTRFEDLQAGTARPTPESIVNPSDAVQARIQARAQRERMIEQDRSSYGQRAVNLEKTGWTSRMHKYF